MSVRHVQKNIRTASSHEKRYQQDQKKTKEQEGNDTEGSSQSHSYCQTSIHVLSTVISRRVTAQFSLAKLQGTYCRSIARILTPPHPTHKLSPCSPPSKISAPFPRSISTTLLKKGVPSMPGLLPRLVLPLSSLGSSAVQLPKATSRARSTLVTTSSQKPRTPSLPRTSSTLPVLCSSCSAASPCCVPEV